MSHPHPTCGQCETPLSPDARFCHRCGRPTVGSGTERHRTAWIAAGVVVLLSAMLALRAGRGPGPTTPNMGSAPGGGVVAAPDISALSPRERFDRLYGRVMVAAEQGDTATVLRFTDHAMFAYAQLDTVDADARYHAAALATQVGRYDVALALADTILATDPEHLFGFVIRGTVAELSGDDALLRQATADFLDVWPLADEVEPTEYADHRPILEAFRRKAEASGSPSKEP